MTSRVVDVRDNFLPPDLFRRAKREVEDARWTANWKSRVGVETSHSNAAFSENVDRHNRRHQDDTLQAHPAVSDVWALIREHVLPGARLVRAYANKYVYGQDGAPHRDSPEPRDRTALLYLVDRWHIDWAGETVFFEGDEAVDIVTPRPNRLIVFPANIMHAGRGVYPTTPIPRVVLVFKATFAPDGEGLSNR
jgi:SM-20-related protein